MSFWRCVPLCFIALSILIVPLTATGYDANPDSLRQSFYELKTELDSAVNEADQEKVIRIKNQLQPFLDVTEVMIWGHYYVGYASYRLSSLFPEMEVERKEELLNQGIHHLELAVTLDPLFAEGWALLGNCYGMKATGFFSGMKYGPKSLDALGKALELTPGNPRVRMMQGISQMYRPPVVGGSLTDALETFRQSSELFQKWDNDELLEPDWGHAENFAWMAQTYIRLEQYEEARRAYGEAVEIEPGYYWVEEVLLPELNSMVD